MKRLVRSLIPLLALAGTTFAQLSPVPPAERNAALKYWAAWSMITPENAKPASDLDWTAIGDQTDPAALPAELREAAEAAASVSGSLIEASKLARCDFEIEYEKGVMVLMPHLGKARQGARMLRAEARWLLASGRAEEGAERLAAILRTAAHLRNDRVMISSLVAIAMANLAATEADVFIASGRLTPAGRDSILAALESLDPADPYDVGQTLVTEHTVFATWIRANFTGPGAGKRLVEEFGTFNDGTEPAEQRAAQMLVSTMDEAALGEALDGLDRFYTDAIGAWKRGSAAAALDTLSEAVARNEYGPVAMVFAPSLSKAFEGTEKSARRIAELREALAALRTPSPDHR